MQFVSVEDYCRILTLVDTIIEM